MPSIEFKSKNSLLREKLDLLLRIASGFVLVASQVACLYVAIMYVSSGLFKIGQTAFYVEAFVLGIAAIYVIWLIYKLVESAERELTDA